VIEAAIRVETDRRQCRRQFAYQHRIGEGEHRVNRIGRGAPVAVLELEAQRVPLLGGIQHRAEASEIDCSAVPFDAEQLGQILRFTRCASGPPQAAQRRFG
jgi:hypothetical protein